MAFVLFSTEALPLGDQPSELHLGQQNLINPLIDCPAAPRALPPKHAEMEASLQEFIREAKQKKRGLEVSLYFRDLNNGPTFGINSSENFSTASLLKVPILIGILKMNEENPGLLASSIVYDPNRHDLANVQQTIDPPEPLRAGTAYTVEFLMQRMIILSDNTATSMILQHVPGLDVISVLKDMGVKLDLQAGEAWLSVRSYASIFRILYNATYLTREHSRMALGLLGQSVMTKGLSAGVAPGTPVAHKFGERHNEGVYQFHDCGIIYTPERPYLLCVMTRGRNSIPDLISVVADISRLVHSKAVNP